MNFNKYHVSRNLFNPNSTRYHLGKGTSNRVAPVTNGAMFYIEADSDTIYTIKVHTTDETFVRLYLSNAPLVEDTAESYQFIAESETTVNPEVTISNTNSTYLWIQVGGTWYTNHGGSSIMLNEGDTALELEPYGNTWTDVPHYIMGTATDTLTTLPAELYPNAATATVGLKGNMNQSGSPTPQNPIQPSETGDETANLLATLTENYAIDASGNINSNSSFMYYTAPCEANETYTFSLDSGLSGSTVRIHAFNGDTWIEQLSGKNINLAPFTVSTPASTTNLKISITKDAKTYHTMLNVGETALPYEPHGIKIPILSGDTTTPVYLGEVQSTRRIVKLVLDGNTSINDYAGGASKVGFVTQVAGILGNRILGKCTHFQTQSTGVGSTIDGVTFGINNSTIYFTFSAASVATYNLSDIASIKQYLADQYSAGTPVTVWYVLATPTTGILNEPIRKIGDYADTVSGISIPTIAGANAVDVLTTLKPSEVTVNYKGWHAVQSVHERENGQWD